MTGDEQTDSAAWIKAARAAAIPATLDPDNPQAFLIPAEMAIVEPDLRAWRSRPARKIGIYKPADVASFIAYTKHHLADDTTVWVHPTTGKTVAVFNDNGQTDPGWADHRAVLDLAPTPEWNYWGAKDGAMISQVDFAEHIEGGLEEIVEPDAADVLEIAQSFHAKSSVTFRSSQRLQSGEQRLQYDESIDAKAGPSGDLLVPTQILLAITPFYGEERYKINARIRFRINGGHLALGYKLDRPDAVLRDAIDHVADALREEFGLTYIGEPIA
jgi:uncharacterized protein YfdQ (DUF2303 family)